MSWAFVSGLAAALPEEEGGAVKPVERWRNRTPVRRFPRAAAHGHGRSGSRAGRRDAADRRSRLEAQRAAAEHEKREHDPDHAFLESSSHLRATAWEGCIYVGKLGR